MLARPFNVGSVRPFGYLVQFGGQAAKDDKIMKCSVPKKLACAAFAASQLLLGCDASRRCPSESTPDPACADPPPPPAICKVEKTVEGRLEPAAIMFVLDRSSSMRGMKWSAATRAIIDSLDDPLFNTTSVGLYSAPSGTLDGPMCIGGIKVACAAPTYPQIRLMAVGRDDGQSTGSLRWLMRDWLERNEPDASVGDATPLYAALRGASDELLAWKPIGGTGRRIMIIITDGTANCASINGGPIKGLVDCNLCYDWEHPQNLIDVIATNNKNERKPIETFVIGVPGSDAYDPRGCDAPKYKTLLALSAMAFAGSPNNVPKDCDGQTFELMGDRPKKPCHFDLSKASFNVDALETAIGSVRGKLLGCELDLPKVWEGTTVDRDHVTVEYTIDGKKMQAARRKDKSSTCEQKGCWDYTADDRVELIGKACTDVRSAPGVKIVVQVGCLPVIG